MTSSLLIDSARTSNLALKDFDFACATDGSSSPAGSGWAVVDYTGKVSSGAIGASGSKFSSSLCEFVAFQKALLKIRQVSAEDAVIFTDAATQSFLTTWSNEKVYAFVSKLTIPALRRGAKIMPVSSFMTLWEDLQGRFVVHHIKAHKTYIMGDLSDPAYLNKLADAAAKSAANSN